jgi:hypothetical protein
LRSDHHPEVLVSDATYGINVTRSTTYVRELGGDPMAVEWDDCEQAAGKPCVDAGGFAQPRPCASRWKRERELRPNDVAARLKGS